MTIICPFCQTVMIENKYRFWHCPDCDAQFRPGPKVDIWKLEQAYKHSLAKKGGSSKKAGRKRERPKKSWWRAGPET